jgi:hypothetical protein
VSFDALHKNTPPEKITDYSLNGQAVVVAPKRGHPKTYRNPEYIGQEKKIEAAALYAVLGDFKQVAELVKLPETVLREMSKEVLWDETIRQVAREGADKFLSKINNLLESALTMLEDRVLHGDCEIIPARPAVIGKDGNITHDATPAQELRTPIKARDLSQIFHALTHQRNLMVGQATSIVQNSTTEEKLKRLQDHFKEFGKLTTVEGSAVLVPEEKK